MVENLNFPAHWDGIYENWRNEGKLGDRGREMADTHEAMLALIPETGSLLDVGCGAGHLLGFLARRRPNMKLTGVDFSPVALELTKRVAPQAVLILSDFLESPLGFTDGEFDVVVSSHVVEHLEAPVAHLRELLRVCAKRLIVNFPVGDQPYVLHVHDNLSVTDISDWLYEAGADIVNHEPVVLGSPNDNGIVWCEFVDSVVN